MSRASVTAAADTPPGTAQPATPSCTGRPSHTARASKGQRQCVSPLTGAEGCARSHVGPRHPRVPGRLLSQGAALPTIANGAKTASDLGTLTVLLRRCGNGNVCSEILWRLRFSNLHAFRGALIFVALVVAWILAGTAIGWLRNRRKFDAVAADGAHLKDPEEPGEPWDQAISRPSGDHYYGDEVGAAWGA